MTIGTCHFNGKRSPHGRSIADGRSHQTILLGFAEPRIERNAPKKELLNASWESETSQEPTRHSDVGQSEILKRQVREGLIITRRFVSVNQSRRWTCQITLNAERAPISP